jgi:hypothetical protein
VTRLFAAGDVAERARITLNQTAIGIVIPRQPFVATAGCIATQAFNGLGSSPVSCQLGDATFRDNRFQDLSWAIFIWADAGTMRIEDNTITQCIGGIWIEPTGVAATIGVLNNPVTAFQEFPIFWSFPLIIYPQQEIIGTRPPVTTPLGDLTLFVTNNQVETILPSTQLSPPAEGTPSDQGSSSLVVLLHALANRIVGANLDTTTSQVITNNRLRNQNSQAWTVLMMVPNNPQRTVISANLIFNEFRRPQPPPPPPAPVPGPPAAAAPNGPSLEILPVSSSVVGLFTVVGNALLGPTNLGSLVRSDPQTPTGTNWVPFNSIVL